MKVGSLFSGGVGGLDIAVERAYDAETVWQLDLVGADVRRRHWPDALQIEADVTQVDPADLPAIDILCGGFSCVDLSCAGQGAGLDEGSRTGPTYRAMLRFAAALRPDVVVMENVPALLSQWQGRLEEDWWALGYGLTWVPCMALDAEAPHRRARVFVIAERGHGRGVLEVDTSKRWDGDRQPWPTPTARDSQASGTSPEAQAEGWFTLTDAAVRSAQPWATPLAVDAKVVKRHGATTLALNYQVRLGEGEPGRRLSPDWVELLMGLPIGWTLPEGPRLQPDAHSGWPRGWWGPEGGWWPGYDYEPPRTYPDHDKGGPKTIPGRPARLRALGNAVCWQQALLALTTQPRQVGLF